MNIIVVGGGITGLTAALTLQRSGIDVTVLEAAERLGGKIMTTEIAGVRVDAGPDAFLVRDPHMTDLADELHLATDLVAPATGSARVWSNGALRALPRKQFLGIPLDLDELASLDIVTLDGVERARHDLDAPADRPTGDETVGSLVRRRLGDEIMDRLVGPLLGGINAGDADELSLDAGVPRLADVLHDDPSIIRSVLAHARANPRDPDAPVFLTHPDGVGRFVTTLTDRLGASVRTNSPVRSVEATPTGWRVVTDDASQDCDGVVVTTPAFAAGDMLAAAAPVSASLLRSIDYASVVMVTFAFDSSDVEAFDGSGFLVPAVEGLLMTACSWASTKWSHLGGRGLEILRVSAGRFNDTRAMEMLDDELIEDLLRELGWVLDIDAQPIEIRITRWPRALPQYRPGHLDLVADIDDALAAEAPGIVVAGAGYRGLGLPACVHQAHVAAHRVATRSAPGTPTAGSDPGRSGGP